MPARGGRSFEHFGGCKTINQIPLPLPLVYDYVLFIIAYSLQSFGLVSKNPVLSNITDYLVEEGSYEEEELLGQSADSDKPKESNPEVTLDRDSKLLEVRINSFPRKVFPWKDDPSGCYPLDAFIRMPSSGQFPKDDLLWMPSSGCLIGFGPYDAVLILRVHDMNSFCRNVGKDIKD